MSHRSEPQWEVSGLISSAGQLARHFGSKRIAVPSSVELGRRALLFSFEGEDDHGQHRAADDMTLTEFIELAHSTDEQILNYAKRWGPLGLCKHGVPAGHRPPPPPPVQVQLWGQDGRWCAPLGREPVEIWRTYATRFRATLDVAAKLHQGSLARSSDWSWLFEELRISRPKSFPLQFQKTLLSLMVNRYVALGNVRPVLVWRGDSHQLDFGEFGTTSLFGALACQLIFAVAKADACSCDGCQKLFFPQNRRPKHSQRIFCPECREKGVPVKFAVKDFRERERRGEKPKRKQRKEKK